MEPGAFVRYLEAKRTVDEHAFNPWVWQRLVNRLPGLSSGGPLRILELGAGIGSMVIRLAKAGLLSNAEYTLLDEQEENLAAARANLKAWTRDSGAYWFEDGASSLISTPDLRSIRLNFVRADALDALAGVATPSDLVIAHAFLDLFDLQVILPAVARVLRPGGLGYFPINFDGLTAFEPVENPAFEERLIAAYHRTMDERMTRGRPSGDSRAGRHLLTLAPRSGLRLLEAGSSDWLVFATDGDYPGDEAYFLRFLVETVVGAVRGRPDIAAADLDAWRARRLLQIDRGELIYLAHQLDVLVEKK